jgi:hypothetical protein
VPDEHHSRRSGDPSDAGRIRCANALDRLHDASVPVERASVQEPDLDEALLALTGEPDSKERTHEHLRDQDSTTMLRRNFRRMVRSIGVWWSSGSRNPPPLFVYVFAHARRRTRAAAAEHRYVDYAVMRGC